MKGSFKVFNWGMLISFLGSLPPGVTNIIASQIFHHKGITEAIYYVTGFMLAEVLVVRIALTGMSRLIRSKKFFHLVEWMMAGMLIVFSTVCFIGANSMQDSPVILPELLLPSFMQGILISLVNPMHIPFWLGWSTVLMNKGVLFPKSGQYNLYIAGIGAGTIAGFAGFIFGGEFLFKAFHSNQYLINCILGFALLAAAFVHIRKMIFVPIAVRHAKLFRRR